MTGRWLALVVSSPLLAVWACGATVETSEPGNDARAGGELGGSSSNPHAGSGGTTGDEAGGAPREEAGSGGSEDGKAGAPDGSEGGEAGSSGAGGTVSSGGAWGIAGGGSAGKSSNSAGSAGNSGTAGASPTPTELLGTHCAGCTAVALGKPAWNLAGLVMGVAPSFGSATDGIAPLRAWLATLFGSKHPLYATENVYGPGSSHAGPYGAEPAALFSAANVNATQAFGLAQFSPTSGVVLVVNAVPNASAPRGSSPDFADGPIIANELFPLYVDGDLRLNGSNYDKEFNYRYVGYDHFTPPIAKAGASHVLIWLGENSSFGPKVDPLGNFDFQLSVVDASGVGWVVHVPFTVQ